MASTINFGGLASGLDTNSIVDQLMALERQPQNRLKLRQGQIDTRKTALTDIATRLKNLRTAAQEMKSATLWADTQSVDVSDSTRVAATRTGGAATGGYQVVVTQLASASQHWFNYPTTPPASANTLTITSGSPATQRQVAISAGATIDDVANTVNADSGSPVYASVVTTAGGTKYLAFSSRTTGSGSDFTVTDSAGAISEDGSRAVTGLNATGTVGNTAFSEPTNVLSDKLPGVQLTLKATTPATGITVTVGAPGPDQTAISAKVKAFVEQYNSTVDFVRSKLAEKPVVNPQTAADYAKGVLHGDTALSGLLGQLRTALSDQFAENDGNPEGLDQLAEIGVSTGGAVGGNTLNQDAIAGKLSFDAAKLTQAMASDPLSVRRLLGGNTAVTDSVAAKFDNLLAPVVQAGGTLDETIKAQDARKRSIADQIARMDQSLSRKQDMLKKQFAAMEAALQGSQSQGQWLAGQLNALNR